ncbi:hypothetical protein MNBD_NITROSPINAE04-733 [hydrothermal vent metagenome]|uniref:TonB C-terminal domain-containing protein n=1 Tax=hydrothermal vent metagenome TaxID=652676 RepID=A0A3B1CKL6_9ZZZZ
MIKPIRKFFLVSVCLHLVFLFLSGFIFIISPGAPPPIKVSFIGLGADNEDIPAGKIEELPEPSRIEKPEKATILSKFDSKAHSPEKGKTYGADKTVIPREKITPAPSMKKSKEEEQAVKPKPPKTKKRLRLSSKTTDQPASKTVKPPQPSGLPDAKGADMETYARAEADNVIDMGDEAVVSFNTRSFIYIDYFNSIRKLIELEWAYPEEAIIQGWRGRVMLRFTIKKSGELESVSLLKSTGHSELDTEAQSAIKLAAPYDPFPATLNKKKIHIVATFVYQPTFSFIK